MTLAEDLGFVDSGTIEWAEKQLKKSENRLKGARLRNDPTIEDHEKVVKYWKVIIGVLHGSN